MVKIIQTLAERAERNGSAKLSRRIGGRLTEVYRIENTGRTVSLFHYNTKTLTIDLELNTLTHVYGESVSDVRSMSTLLDYYNIQNVHFTYRPSIGEFYIITRNNDTLYTEPLSRLDMTYNLLPCLMP